MEEKGRKKIVVPSADTKGGEKGKTFISSGEGEGIIVPKKLSEKINGTKLQSQKGEGFTGNDPLPMKTIALTGLAVLFFAVILGLAIWANIAVKNMGKSVTNVAGEVKKNNLQTVSLSSRIRNLEDRTTAAENNAGESLALAKRAIVWLTKKFGPADEENPQKLEPNKKPVKVKNPAVKKITAKKAVEKNPWKGCDDPNVILPKEWR
jgi:hypothetical protein